MTDLKRLSDLSAGLPLCRRCMLEETANGADVAALLRQLIASIPAGQRESDEITNRRLAVCRTCDHLFSGTCALCGCFVELRAAKRNAACPDIPDRWRP